MISLAFMLAACAAQHSGSSSPSTVTATGQVGKCGDVVAKGSKLATDIEGMKRQPDCRVYYDKKGNAVDVFQGGGKLSPYSQDFSAIATATNKGLEIGFASRLIIFVGKFRDNVSIQDLDMDAAEALGSKAKFELRDESVVAAFKTGTKPGKVITVVEPDTSVVNVCVQADTIGSRNAPTRAFVCRSVAKSSSPQPALNEAIIEVAGKIAREDFADLNP
jgi:hypothetical protein